MHFGGANSLGDLANHLNTTAMKSYRAQLAVVSGELGKAVETGVKEAIGSYNSGWAQLTPATLDRKTKSGLGMGGNPDTPLYASGEFFESTAHKVEGLTTIVGSTKPEAVYTELGTSDQPPRPVFGPVALQVVPRFLPIIGQYAGAGIAGLQVRTFSR